MSRYKTFFIFLTLVIFWALFFATIKFFLWGDLSETIRPDLQQIAGYLSIGSAVAFLVGWAFAQTFLKKYYLFAIALLSFFFVSYGYIFGFTSPLIFAAMVTIIGFLYGLWNVMKSVIVSIEIKKTWLPETAVTAIVWMMFVACIIVGSILGSVIYEKMWHAGYILLLGYLVIILIASFSLDYDGVTFRSLLTKGWRSYLFGRRQNLIDAMRLYIPDMKYVIKNHAHVIVTSSIFWALSTIISQASVEFSVEAFDKKNSEATMILLYSAVGAIAWSFLSIRMNRRRWHYFYIFSMLFALTVFLLPIFSTSFSNLAILATILGICFGTSVNLSDSYLLKCFWDENKKEYGASTMGLMFSVILFVSMFLSSIAINAWGFETLMYVFSGIIAGVSTTFYLYQRSK